MADVVDHPLSHIRPSVAREPSHVRKTGIRPADHTDDGLGHSAREPVPNGRSGVGATMPLEHGLSACLASCVHPGDNRSETPVLYQGLDDQRHGVHDDTATSSPQP
jgi:hypothetical protein